MTDIGNILKPCVIVLAGHKGAGKSVVAAALSKLLPRVSVISTSAWLKQLVDVTSRDAVNLQTLGGQTDIECPRWVNTAVAGRVDTALPNIVVVDAVRTVTQIKLLEVEYSVVPVWVECNGGERVQRLINRGQSLDAVNNLTSDPIETAVSGLRSHCGVHINTSGMNRSTLHANIEASVAHITRLFSGPAYQTHVVIGAQYGSEGKGNVVAWYGSRQSYQWLVRTGGPNAGHTVWFEHPAQHTGPDAVKQVFHHLPSATLHSPNSKIVLGPGAVLNLDVLIREVEQCEALGVPVWERLHISPDAFVITTDDIGAEAGIVGTIGSTGQGVGAATMRRAGRDQDTRISQWDGSQWYKPQDKHAELQAAVARYHGIEYNGLVMLEGTQGFGLSLLHGHYPHVTSRDTGVAGLLSEAGLRWDSVTKVTAVCRTYPIRVESPVGGTSGPLNNETSWGAVAKSSGVAADLAKVEVTTTKRQRRVGKFSWNQLRHTCDMNGVTHLVLTFADYHNSTNRTADSFVDMDSETVNHVAAMRALTGCIVDAVSVGPLIGHVVPTS
jgi:adenylosuccinate synthase